MNTASATASNLKKFGIDELTYRNLGSNGNAYSIDCYKEQTLLMTYKGYYNHKTGDFTLYPSVCHKLDPRIPGKHKVHITKMK